MADAGKFDAEALWTEMLRHGCTCGGAATAHIRKGECITCGPAVIAKAHAAGRREGIEEAAEAVFAMTQQRSKAEQIRALLAKEPA